MCNELCSQESGLCLGLPLNMVHKFSKILADIKNVEKPSIWSPHPLYLVVIIPPPPPPPVLGSKIIFVRGLHLSEGRREQRDRMVKRKHFPLLQIEKKFNSSFWDSWWKFWMQRHIRHNVAIDNFEWMVLLLFLAHLWEQSKRELL